MRLLSLYQFVVISQTPRSFPYITYYKYAQTLHIFIYLNKKHVVNKNMTENLMKNNSTQTQRF